MKLLLFPFFSQSSAEADPSCCLLWALSVLKLSTLLWQDVAVLKCAQYSGGRGERNPLCTDALALLTPGENN